MRQAFVLLLLLTLGFGTVAAQAPRTVTDYFMLFPGERFSTDNEGNQITSKAKIAAFRRSMIKIEDVKNGYLRVEGAWEGWDEFAVFKRKDGTALIAHTSVGCGPACSGSIAFYEYKNGKFVDVTTSVMDVPTDDLIAKVMKRKKLGDADGNVNWYYALPRIGTDVKVLCSICDANDDDAGLLVYGWNGTTFAVK